MSTREKKRRDEVLEALEANEKEMRRAEILERVDMSGTRLDNILEELLDEREIVRVKRGIYDLPENVGLGEDSRRRLKEARQRAGLGYSTAARYLQERGEMVDEDTLIGWERETLQEPPPVDLEDVIELLELHARNKGSQASEDEEGLELEKVQEIIVGAGDETAIEPVDSGLALPKSYIRTRYGVRPDRLCIMRVRGNSMVDTLRPDQRVVSAMHKGKDLREGAVYGIRGPLGFAIKRLRFDRIEGEPVIWIWSDNDECADQRHYVTRETFDHDYEVIAKALEVGHGL